MAATLEFVSVTLKRILRVLDGLACAPARGKDGAADAALRALHLDIGAYVAAILERDDAAARWKPDPSSWAVESEKG